MPIKRFLLGALFICLFGINSLDIWQTKAASFVIKRGYADGPFGQVHYQDVVPDSSKGLPLLLLHQAPMTLRQFDSVYGLLAEQGIRSIAIDTPGFGQSSVPSFVPKVDDYATAIPAVLDHLGIKRADLLGHHTGALIATSVALQYPNRVKNLIINGAFPMTNEERANYLKRNKEHEQDFVYAPDGSHLLASFQGRYKMYGGKPNPRVITRYVTEKFIGLGPFWYGHHAAFQYNFNAALMQVKHRALILTNTGDQIYSNALLANEMRPDIKFIELKGGGVDVVDQLPRAWTNSVIGFLRE